MINKKWFAFTHLMLILPLASLLQSCPDCGDFEVFIDITAVNWRVQNNSIVEPGTPDRNRIQLVGSVVTGDPQTTMSGGPFLFGAYATTCDPDEIITSSIASVAIYEGD